MIATPLPNATPLHTNHQNSILVFIRIHKQIHLIKMYVKSDLLASLFIVRQKSIEIEFFKYTFSRIFFIDYLILRNKHLKVKSNFVLLERKRNVSKQYFILIFTRCEFGISQ